VVTEKGGEHYRGGCVEWFPCYHVWERYEIKLKHPWDTQKKVINANTASISRAFVVSQIDSNDR